LDFARLYTLTQCLAFFIIRARKDFRFRCVASQAVDKSTGLRCDQTIRLVSFYPLHGYPENLRRIRYCDRETDRQLIFLTNNFSLPALIIPQLYKCRWQVELFFKWIKQHLRIKAFYGLSENAVKTQIWTAIAVYVLVAIVRKRLGLDLELHAMLQILSVALFEKIPLIQVLTQTAAQPEVPDVAKQLQMFTF
jgi:IS4 transposase